MQLGIVRRIDELGRIVIPKEMRRSMRLEVGDEMEIFSDGEMLSLKRASGLSGNIKGIKTLTLALAKNTDADVIVSDLNYVLVCEGKNKKRYSGGRMSDALCEIVRARKAQVLHGDELKNAINCECCYLVLEPIFVGGDLVGSIMLMLDCLPSDIARAYLNFCATLIGSTLG